MATSKRKTASEPVTNAAAEPSSDRGSGTLDEPRSRIVPDTQQSEIPNRLHAASRMTQLRRTFTG
jgi:hypothetical protein